MAVDSTATHGPSRTGIPLPYVIETNGEPGGLAGNHINCGKFWNQSANSTDALIGNCWWEVLLKITRHGQGGYALSDGYGGGHALLDGYQTNAGIGYGAGYQRTGNFRVYDTVGLAYSTVSWSSQTCDVIGLEWGHSALGLSTNGTIFQYWNGILVGLGLLGTDKQRTSLNDSAGNGTLYVAGSDHSMLAARYALVAGYDGNKFASFGAQDQGAYCAFRPPIRPTSPRATFVPDFLLDCTKPGLLAPDMSVGLVGVATTSVNYRGGVVHHGVPEFALPGNQDYGAGPVEPPWVQDGDCPLYLQKPYSVANAIRSSTAALPTDHTYKIWDDFAGKRSDPICTETPTLGSTDARGTLGALLWQQRAYVYGTNTWANWGVMFGLACPMGRQASVEAFNGGDPVWVETGSASGGCAMEVPVGAIAGTITTTTGVGNIAPELVFRLVDADNFLAVEIGVNQARLRRFVAGTATLIATAAMPANWRLVKAEYSGDNIIISGGTGTLQSPAWTEVHNVTEATHNTGTKVGMASCGGTLTRIKQFGAW